MSYCTQLNINIPNLGNYIFYYSYNNNSNYSDLLESFAFNFPTLNICPCYKIQYNYSNGIYNDINMDGKISTNLITNLQFVYKNNNNKCMCNEIQKKQFIKNKCQIIEELCDIYAQNILFQNTIKNKDEIINNYKKTEKDLNFKNSNLKNEKISLKDTISNLTEKLRTSETINKNQDKEIKNLKLQIENLNNTIVALQNDKSNLIQEKSNLELKIFKVVDKVDLLGNKNEIAKEEINQLKLEIKNQNEQRLINEKRLEDLRIEKEQLIQERKENTQLNRETNFTDFYDVIIDIKSIKDISKGWKIKMSEKAKQNYDNYKKEENLKIGIIGNANKGKSFLLSKISKIKLPSSTSIRTEGLSIKYPELEGYENRKIVLLDSAGLETPVLKEDIETLNQLEEIQEKKEKDLFKEKSREKLITELFLQNYIINNSDVLIIVVGILTYSEQKLLNRIKTDFLKSRNKNKIEKPLFIIHNLMTYETVQQVEEYINDCLLKSATFDLKIGHNISTKESKKKGIYYYERNITQKIFHLIFARDKSDAGKFYNDSTLDFLENIYQNVIDLKSFDVIETVKDSFIEISKDILEKTEQPLTKNNYDNSNKDLIKLNNANNFTLKKCLIDELGFSNLKANGFEPTYNCYKQDKKIIVRVEAPGNSTLNSSFEHGSQYNIIRINGTKIKDQFPEKLEDNIYNLREYGNFSIDIPINPDEYIIKNEPPKIYVKKGVIFIEYELDDQKKFGELKINENDII